MIAASLRRSNFALARLTVCLTASTLLAGCGKSPAEGEAGIHHAQNLPAQQILVEKNEHKPGDIAEVEIAKGVMMKFCWVPPGEAQLGSPKEEQDYVVKTFFQGRRPDFMDRESEAARGKFKTNGFWMGKYAVTQAEWEAVMGNNPSRFSKNGGGSQQVAGMDTGRLPVENVPWDNCQKFLSKLNDAAKLPAAMGKGKFDLPHEDQWEYACRGGRGNKQPFYFGHELDGSQANCDGRDPYGTTAKGRQLYRTSEVGSYEKVAPHPWGLCDMHGNVCQWCQNKYDGGNFRVLRGGSWGDDSRFCCSAIRFKGWPEDPISQFGFRVVCLP
jgi:formylglycine-generating enzyme required for sulfatase activity